VSAFVVSKQHIDALVTAGVEWGHGHIGGSRLSWLTPTEDDPPQTGEEYWTWLNARRRELNDSTADAVGQMLVDACVASVAYRYQDDTDLPGPIEHYWTQPYAHRDFPIVADPLGGTRAIDPVQILKAISCYEYQSCEHPDWEKSEASVFCDVLRRRAISNLPGYDVAPWEVREGAGV
jgi:hypothetical protein